MGCGGAVCLSLGDVNLERVSLELLEPIPAELPVAARLAVKVQASCPAGRDLRGARIDVLAADEIVATGSLGEFHDGGNAGELAVTAPERLGEFTWRLVFPRQDIGGTAYQESALTLAFRTRPHQTSLAVWDIPTPVTVDARFRIKVGAKSSGNCALAGTEVRILDAGSTEAGRATLADAPLAGTDALYFAEIALVAPAHEGQFSWTAAFAAEGATMPHLGASTAFSFVVVEAPQHRLTVKVVEAESGAPVDEVQIGLGPYRAATDANGLAQIATAAGRYELAVWKADFEAPPITLDIDKDASVTVELTPLPKERTPWD
jgi:hypothetical protein